MVNEKRVVTISAKVFIHLSLYSIYDVKYTADKLGTVCDARSSIKSTIGILYFIFLKTRYNRFLKLNE